MGRILALAIVVVALLAGHAGAAEITIGSEKLQGFSVIVIKGEINTYDEERFDNVAMRVDKGLVLLDSPGGDVWAGINIGKTVRMRNYVTVVPKDTSCASACAYIWLAGVDRIVYPGAQVGFHAAYRVENGQATESGTGNALIGAYLNQLNINYSSIAYFTSAPPQGMEWLSEQKAKELGISAYFIKDEDLNSPTGTSGGQVADAPSPPPVQQPTAPARTFVAMKDRDVFGFDIGAPFATADALACEQRCASYDRCVAYTFNTAKSLCFLKENGKNVLWNKNATGGYVRSIEGQLSFLKIVILNSTGLQGTTYFTSTGYDLERCATACNAESRCTGFEFERRPNNECRLKEGSLKKQKKPRQTAGVKTSD